MLRFISTVLVLFLFACSNKKTELVNLDLIEFDVTKQYPEKKLDIHDLADISYVLLEMEEDYLFQYPWVSITSNFIIINNQNGEGFLFFDRNGNPVSKVYRQGEGAEEYRSVRCFLYVEEEDNLYVALFYNEKIKVYSKEGIFKREYFIPKEMWVDGVYDYDKNNLLLYFPEQQTPFALLSKKDGRITFLDDMFVEKPNDMLVRFDKVTMPNGRVLHNGSTVFRGYYAVKNGNDFLLMPYPLDTAIYRLDSDKHISSLLRRTPSFEDTDPKIALHNIIETSNYLFFSSVRMEHDKETGLPFPKTGYLIDKNNRQIYTQKIIDRDFEGKELMIDASSVNTFLSPNVGILSYHIDELIEADEKNKLKGKLKETFDRMDEEDHYIFLIYQLK